jgi:hypothetical protein
MFNKVKEFVSNKKVLVGSAVGAGSALAASAPAWCADSTFSITSAMVEPIQTSISSGLTTLVPIGITIMAAMIGISLIPRIIYKFL